MAMRYELSSGQVNHIMRMSTIVQNMELLNITGSVLPPSGSIHSGMTVKIHQPFGFIDSTLVRPCRLFHIMLIHDRCCIAFYLDAQAMLAILAVITVLVMAQLGHVQCLVVRMLDHRLSIAFQHAVDWQVFTP